MGDADALARDLARQMEERAIRAFKGGLANVEGLSKDLCPVGHYGRARGRAGRAGGDLRQSIRVEFVGQKGRVLQGHITSSLPYAEVQHDDEFHHPGLYTGAAGPAYVSRFVEAAVDYIFSDKALYNPGNLPALPGARFKELL
jgi:hypothetical protein